MKPVLRRPLLATIALAAVALLATTASGAASAAGRQPEQTVATLPAAVVVPAGRVPALVSASASTALSEAPAAANRQVAANRPPCDITAKACVSLGARKAWITDGAGRVLFGPVGVLGGRKGEPTPVGTFSVTNKVRNYHSRQFDAPMPWSVFFYPGVAFHTGSLGTRSAGCLHLSNASAKTFFSMLSPGDEVQILS